MAAVSFTEKMTTGLGGLVAGLLIDLIAFPQQAAPGEVSDEAVRNLGLIGGPGIAWLVLVAAWLLTKYPLTHDRHKIVLTQLDSQAAPVRIT